MAIRDVVAMDLPAFRRFVRRTAEPVLAEWLIDHAADGIRSAALTPEQWTLVAHALKTGKTRRALVHGVLTADTWSALGRLRRVARSSLLHGQRVGRRAQPTRRASLAYESRAYDVGQEPENGFEEQDDFWSVSYLWEDHWPEEYEQYRPLGTSPLIEECLACLPRDQSVLSGVFQNLHDLLPDGVRPGTCAIADVVDEECRSELAVQFTRPREEQGVSVLKDGEQLTQELHRHRIALQRLLRGEQESVPALHIPVDVVRVLDWLGRIVSADTPPTERTAGSVTWTVFYLILVRDPQYAAWRGQQTISTAWIPVVEMGTVLATRELTVNKELLEVWRRSEVLIRQSFWADEDEQLLTPMGSQSSLQSRVRRLLVRGIGTLRSLRYPEFSLARLPSDGEMTPETTKQLAALEDEMLSFRAAVRSATMSQRRLTFKPLPKAWAVRRTRLTGAYVPDRMVMRALLPHFTYYGVWNGDRPLRVYVTVVKAWAKRPGGDRVPVLVLENVADPEKRLHIAMDDLLEVLDAVAVQRGLFGGLVVSVGRGTWMRGFETRARTSARYHGGSLVEVDPADPGCWALYDALTQDGSFCTAFHAGFGRRAGWFGERLVSGVHGPMNVDPANHAEAARIRRLPRCSLIETARDANGCVGFISEWPSTSNLEQISHTGDHHRSLL